MKSSLLKIAQRVLSVLSGVAFVVFIISFSNSIDILGMIGLSPWVSAGIVAGAILLLGLVSWAEGALNSSESEKH